MFVLHRSSFLKGFFFLSHWHLFLHHKLLRLILVSGPFFFPLTVKSDVCPQVIFTLSSCCCSDHQWKAVSHITLYQVKNKTKLKPDECTVNSLTGKAWGCSSAVPPQSSRLCPPLVLILLTGWFPSALWDGNHQELEPSASSFTPGKQRRNTVSVNLKRFPSAYWAVLQENDQDPFGGAWDTKTK